MEATLSPDGKFITVTLPISPRPSASGKTLVVASSNGNHATTAIHNGKQIVIGFNAYIQR